MTSRGVLETSSARFGALAISSHLPGLSVKIRKSGFSASLSFICGYAVYQALARYDQ